jgi:catechol 2,3-dioxygenase
MTKTGTPSLTLGPISLTIADLSRSIAFYTDRIGLQVQSERPGQVYLGAGNETLVRLHEDRNAQHPGRSSGLYHFAILVPSRMDLAYSLQQLAVTRTPVQGFADHLVSEAIYLPDPDGNGIEIYRDRPRDQWPRLRGQIQMATDPLDVDSLLEEAAADGTSWDGIAEGTVMGHMHLHVGDLAAAEAFYEEVIGLDNLMTLAGSASFLSQDDYHHHLGINIWAGRGAPAAPPGSVGLRDWTLRISDPADAETIQTRAEALDHRIDALDDGFALRDPSGNQVNILSSPSESATP